VCVQVPCVYILHTASAVTVRNSSAADSVHFGPNPGPTIQDIPGTYSMHRLNLERPNIEQLNLERLNIERPNLEILNLEYKYVEYEPI
jgi:hypothetical protein